MIELTQTKTQVEELEVDPETEDCEKLETDVIKPVEQVADLNENLTELFPDKFDGGNGPYKNEILWPGQKLTVEDDAIVDADGDLVGYIDDDGNAIKVE